MNEKELLEDFEINPLTIAVLPMEYGGKLYSKVYQLDEELYIPYKPLDLIKKGCITYCSSYEGRKAGSRHLTGITHKIPITIDSTNSMFYFPTISPNKPHCAWISHEHVKDYKKVNSKNTQVIFRNNLSIVIPISIYSFETQLFRTALLRTKLAQKLNEHNRRNMVLYNNHSRASEQVTGYGEDNRI